MTKERKLALYLILIGAGLSALWACFLGWAMPGGPIDFQAIYLGSRTLIQHHNPYSVSEMERVFDSLGGYGVHFPDPQLDHQLLVLFVNLPTTLLIFAPFTLLPMGVGQVIWIFLEVLSLMLAAFLVWDLGTKCSPVLSAWMIGLFLANCESVLSCGNTAGIVIGLSIIAVWCFLKERWVVAGVVCMALALAIKPHDSGFIWLFFLLAGRTFRRRAIQSAVLACLLVIPAFVWVSYTAPHWFQDWQSNLAVISMPGQLNDPRPNSVSSKAASSIISLQAAFSIFIPNEQVFNLAAYLVCGVLVLVWSVTTLRSRPNRMQSLLALATIASLSLLITYHRVYDAKLLLLTIPACAVLWASTGGIRWMVLFLNSAALFVTSDIPVGAFHLLSKALHLSAATLSGRILILLLDNPSQGVLLALSIFYLWVYVKSTRVQSVSAADLSLAHEADAVGTHANA